MVVPAGTPAPIVAKLRGRFNQITASEETRKFLANIASDALPGDGALMASLIKRDMERWPGFIKLANIQPE